MRTALREASIALDGRVLSTLALLRDLQTLLASGTPARRKDPLALLPIGLKLRA
ncbi:MAG: hypothetical protein WBM48_17010 [Polyangiales bacterium]|jgi:hypothetical protein